jgi:hypothetical protein
MASPTIPAGSVLGLTSTNWDSVNKQVFGTFVSANSAGRLVMCMSANATIAQGLVPFTGVASSGLTFTRRTGSTLAAVNSLDLKTEVWTAPFSSSLNQRVNFNFSSGNWNNGAFIVFEVAGLYSNASPWDSNAAEPDNQGSTTSPLPTQHITTSQADDLLIYISNGVDSNTQPPNQAGWSLVKKVIDTAGLQFGNMQINSMSVSATQAALAVDSNNRGIGYIDAFTGDGALVLQTFVTTICT